MEEENGQVVDPNQLNIFGWKENPPPTPEEAGEPEREAVELPPTPDEWADPNQEMLFELPPPAWAKDWEGMPSYGHEEQQAWLSVKVHFVTQGDWVDFFQKIGQKPTKASIWHPRVEPMQSAHMRYESECKDPPRYPVYVISKGRWESRLTVKALDRIGVPYNVVVEPQEYDDYAAVIAPGKILRLPFSNLGLGSIPARNWVWEHSIAAGAERHWILDDNIRNFYRFHENMKFPADGTIFRAAEDFTDRYENVALSGMQYFMFVPRKRGRIQPFAKNTRIYSCILIKNDIPFRWRGRYNEDTDLSLRVLKAGLPTILFYAFLAEKMPTMTMKGGNTEALYLLGDEDGRLKMAQSLQEQHPDVTKITRKWGRWQHSVNYMPFRRNELVLKPGATQPAWKDDYGMSLKPIEGKKAKEAATDA